MASPDKIYWKMYWRVHGNESKVWLDLPLPMQKATSGRDFINLGDQTITPEIWRRPRYPELFLDTLESSR